MLFAIIYPLVTTCVFLLPTNSSYPPSYSSRQTRRKRYSIRLRWCRPLWPTPTPISPSAVSKTRTGPEVSWEILGRNHFALGHGGLISASKYMPVVSSVQALTVGWLVSTRTRSSVMRNSHNARERAKRMRPSRSEDVCLGVWVCLLCVACLRIPWEVWSGYDVIVVTPRHGGSLAVYHYEFKLNRDSTEYSTLLLAYGDSG